MLSKSLVFLQGKIFFTETANILSCELPQSIETKIIYTEPGVKGDTATNATKLAKIETDQAYIIKQFLPEQLTEIEIEKIVCEIISKINASGMKDMGKVMGLATKELSGKADGKTISQIVRKNLS